MLSWHGLKAMSFRPGFCELLPAWLESGGIQCGNVQLSGGYAEIHRDSVSRDAIPTTNVEYQYGDLNLLAVHHALLNSGLEPQPVSLTVTLPLSEYYDGTASGTRKNIRRKRENLMRELVLNKGQGIYRNGREGDAGITTGVLPSRGAETRAETTLIIDLGGTTLDAGVIVGFDDIRCGAR
uniref:Plasmid segregation protein ParM n=1 Tax=Klebsiella pneumoniae TaxID=573 RepID=A0A2P1BPI5_KLEPN|nr:Plasmid segregation protein ParM [Klebsiella pneumoniae]